MITKKQLLSKLLKVKKKYELDWAIKETKRGLFATVILSKKIGKKSYRQVGSLDVEKIK